MRYGYGPHQHDGKVCVLSLAIHKDDQLAVLPDAPDTSSTPPVRFEIDFSYVDDEGAFVRQVSEVKTSARSPPTQ